jgi:hypothetical protein
MKITNDIFKYKFRKMNKQELILITLEDSKKQNLANQHHRCNELNVAQCSCLGTS